MSSSHFLSNKLQWLRQHWKSILSTVVIAMLAFVGGLKTSDSGIYLRHNFVGDNFGIYHVSDYKLTDLNEIVVSQYRYNTNKTLPSIIVTNQWSKELSTKVMIYTDPPNNGFTFGCEGYYRGRTYNLCNNPFDVKDNQDIIIKMNISAPEARKYDLCVKVWEYTDPNNYEMSCAKFSVDK